MLISDMTQEQKDRITTAAAEMYQTAKNMGLTVAEAKEATARVDTMIRGNVRDKYAEIDTTPIK